MLRKHVCPHRTARLQYHQDVSERRKLVENVQRTERGRRFVLVIIIVGLYPQPLNLGLMGGKV